MTREQEIAWAAGLFEGEGSISIRDRRLTTRAITKSARLAMSLTDLDVLERFHHVLGRGAIRGPDQRQPHHKPCWRWYVDSSADVIYVLSLLTPYLGARRSAKAGEARQVAWVRLYGVVERRSDSTLFGVRMPGCVMAQLKAALGVE